MQFTVFFADVGFARSHSKASRPAHHVCWPEGDADAHRREEAGQGDRCEEACGGGTAEVGMKQQSLPAT